MDPNSLSAQLTQLDQSYNPVQIYNDVTSKLGIPDARTRVQALQQNLVNTQNAIDAVAPSVQGRTQNALVTDAQRSRLVNMEQQPLQTNYSKQNTDYGVQQGNLAQLQTEGDRQVAAAAADYQTRRQSLATQLDYALKQQAAAQAKAEADRAFAEQQREFNAQQAAARSGGGGGGGGGGRSSSGGSSGSSGPQYRQRSDGSYGFVNAQGQGISARLYAQLTGTDFNRLLQTMAANGDSGAKDVLKNGGRAAAYHAMTWD